ncbi:hypothetical protein BEN30_09060 [Magnetovibrio blakemorei]|uniref:Nitrogen fixation protein FixH n=2 Tax=Magnetovibrio blakemorei TaxID=28181 RepID=A0A1E5Q8D9_9PROT|nr:hypothetical protein BEN30_09060 [Magnetovibrio blakemorei]
MTAMNKSERPDGWWYPWIFVGAFAIIFAVNGTMAYFAVSTWSGLETKDYYKEGIGYNDTLHQRSQQAELGWTSTLSYENIPVANDARAGQLRLHFTDKDGRAIEGLYINALAVRPIQEGFDQELIFTYRGKGLYAANVTLPLPGLWELRYTAKRKDQLFKMRQRVQIR